MLKDSGRFVLLIDKNEDLLEIIGVTSYRTDANDIQDGKTQDAKTLGRRT